MTAAQVHAFFASYADAFGRSAIEEICDKWAYPAYMVARGKRTSLDESAFRQNAEVLCAFYRTQGLARAEKEVLEISRLTASTASVRTADTFLDDAGEKIADWQHVYILSETDTGLKLVVAMPDGELAAWRARGTPLGNW